jgi:hypothetical protein
VIDKNNDKLGIKQTLQRPWMDRAVQMLLAGMSEKEIRADLNEFLKTQKQSGGIGERGRKTYAMATALLASWFSPAPNLVTHRNEVLKFARGLTVEEWLPLHWIIVSASYPFWFNVAIQVGRLFNLQDHITQTQVFRRVKEQYGDRETVVRNARYTIRSFVAWGVLRDCEIKGCYEKSPCIYVSDPYLAILMLESGLHATNEGKGSLRLLLNNPAFFPFQLPFITGDFVSQQSDRIDVIPCGWDDHLLRLK